MGTRQELKNHCISEYQRGVKPVVIAKETGLAATTVRRYLRDAGYQLRKPAYGVVDGKKQCKVCEQWIETSQYHKRKTGGYSSYCKSCDTKKAVASAKRSRLKSKKEIKEKKCIIDTYHQNSIKLLKLVIDRYHHYNCDVLQRVKGHLAQEYLIERLKESITS